MSFSPSYATFATSSGDTKGEKWWTEASDAGISEINRSKIPYVRSSDHPRTYLDEFSKPKGSASLLLQLTYTSLAAASSGRNFSVCTGWQLSRNLQAAAWSSKVTAYRKGKNRIGTQREPGQQVPLQYCQTLQSFTSGFCSPLCKHQWKGIWNVKK